MSISRPRVAFLSAARVIGILLVVLGHSYPFDVPISRAAEWVRQFIYVFHMPLFVFISGYLAAGSRYTIREYVIRRGKRLLIPYFSLSLLAYIPKVLVQQYLNDSVSLDILWLLRSELIPRENVWGHFWYLPVIFFLGCFGAAAVRWMRKSGWVCLFLLLMGFGMLFLPRTTDWFALEDIRKVFFYYVLGMVMGCRTELKIPISGIKGVLLLPGAAAVFLAVDGTAGKAIAACLMIGFILWIGKFWGGAVKSPWNIIEKYSYTIYLLSWPAQAVTEVVTNKLLELPVAVCMVCMFAAGIGVPVACAAGIGYLGKKHPLGWLRAIAGL